MLLDPRRRTPRRSPTRDWRAVSPASMRGNGIGLVEATDVSYRDELGKYGRVTIGSMAPLFWKFLVRLVWASAISGMFEVIEVG